MDEFKPVDDRNVKFDTNKKTDSWLKSFKKLQKSQYFSLSALLLLLVTLPLATLLASRQNYLMSRAKTPATSPTTPPSKITPVETEEFPMITTQSLDDAKYNKQYSQKVQGYDANVGDTLTMSTSNLPQGLMLGNCKTQGKYSNNITCTITGKPQEVGKFNVEFFVSDDTGNTSKKELQLVVKN